MKQFIISLIFFITITYNANAQLAGLKNIVDDTRLKSTGQSLDFAEDPNVKVFSESDEYQCKQGECDI